MHAILGQSSVSSSVLPVVVVVMSSVLLLLAPPLPLVCESLCSPPSPVPLDDRRESRLAARSLLDWSPRPRRASGGEELDGRGEGVEVGVELEHGNGLEVGARGASVEDADGQSSRRSAASAGGVQDEAEGGVDGEAGAADEEAVGVAEGVVAAVDAVLGHGVAEEDDVRLERAGAARGAGGQLGQEFRASAKFGVAVGPPLLVRGRGHGGEGVAFFEKRVVLPAIAGGAAC
mmetsp:Transcript_5278/g.16596  ORF Transcript_5278/g.16596 Transcript_5278/m.16596 type:complete len:232 (-) Transcript_5278:206-901(-)